MRWEQCVPDPLPLLRHGHGEECSGAVYANIRLLHNLLRKSMGEENEWVNGEVEEGEQMGFREWWGMIIMKDF